MKEKLAKDVKAGDTIQLEDKTVLVKKVRTYAMQDIVKIDCGLIAPLRYKFNDKILIS